MANCEFEEVLKCFSLVGKCLKISKSA